MKPQFYCTGREHAPPEICATGELGPPAHIGETWARSEATRANNLLSALGNGGRYWD